jgi:hypothetical protein
MQAGGLPKGLLDMTAHDFASFGHACLEPSSARNRMA